MYAIKYNFTTLNITTFKGMSNSTLLDTSSKGYLKNENKNVQDEHGDQRQNEANNLRAKRRNDILDRLSN